MSALLSLLLLVPLTGAVLVVLLGRQRVVAHMIVVLVAGINLVYGVWLMLQVQATGRQVTHIGNWQPPIAISLVADGLSMIVVVVGALLTLVVVLLVPTLSGRQHETLLFWPAWLLLLLGINGVALTADLFNLFLWLEVTSLAAVVLVASGDTRARLKLGTTCLLVSLAGGACLLVGCALAYSLTGTLNMAFLNERLILVEHPGRATVLASLCVLAVGIKLVAALLLFWLPTDLAGPPAALLAVPGVLLAVAALAALYRLLGHIFAAELSVLAPFLLLSGGLLLAGGVLAALAQQHLRRLLALLLLAQCGAILVSLGLMSANSAAAGMLLLLYDTLALTALICLSCSIELAQDTDELNQMSSLARQKPLLTVLWLLASLMLAGILPLGSFFARLTLLQAALSQQAYLTAALVSLVGVLLVLPLLRLWHAIFWNPVPAEAEPPRPISSVQLVPTGVLLLVLLGLGMAIGPLSDYCAIAGSQALDASGYRVDVLQTTGTVSGP